MIIERSRKKINIEQYCRQWVASGQDHYLSVALTLFFVPVRFRTLSESETAVSDSETTVSAAETTVSAAETAVSTAETTVSAAETIVSAAETTVFRPLKRPFSYFRTRKRYAKPLDLLRIDSKLTHVLVTIKNHFDGLSANRQRNSGPILPANVTFSYCDMVHSSG